MYKAIIRDKDEFLVVATGDNLRDVLIAGRKKENTFNELIITENDKVIWREMRA